MNWNVSDSVARAPHSSLALAERNDAALKAEKSLISGAVEYIAVRPGELVSAGTVLMTIRSQAQATTIEATLPKATADALVDTGIAPNSNGR
ncbi:MAG: hypothetical protein IPJ68_06360 [Candidatus Moraniibacteriota bacterium]|nr:MAG: hypothetical protein IPJ68_06360 [Candidatus Moranbacteria bacterium]